jgi:hypothetical protein
LHGYLRAARQILATHLGKGPIMGTFKAFLKGALLGAGAIYFFDPRLGKRRRSIVADQVRRLSRKASCAVDAGVRDLGNRTRGVAHDVGSFVGRGEWPNSQQRQTNMMERCPLGMSPGARLVSAACGTALMANCVARRTLSAALWGTFGFLDVCQSGRCGAARRAGGENFGHRGTTRQGV